MLDTGLFFGLESDWVFDLWAWVGSGLKVPAWVGPAFFGFRAFNASRKKMGQFFQVYGSFINKESASCLDKCFFHVKLS